MISDRTRNEVWTGLLNINRTCRYYEKVHSRATRWTIWVRVGILVLVAGGVTAILDLLPLGDSGNLWAKAAIVLFLTSLTIWDVVANFQKRATIAQVIYTQCSKLRIEWRELWLSVDDASADEEQVRRQMALLERDRVESESWAGYSDVMPDKKLNEKAAQEAYDITEKQYNAGTQANPGGAGQDTATRGT